MADLASGAFDELMPRAIGALVGARQHNLAERVVVPLQDFGRPYLFIDTRILYKLEAESMPSHSQYAIATDFQPQPTPGFPHFLLYLGDSIWMVRQESARH